MLAEFIAPLPSTASVTGRGEALGTQGFNVLLALDYENVPRAIEQLRQAIRHAPHAVDVPYPISFAIRFALSELLSCKPYYLVEQCALLIAIIEYRLGRFGI